MRKRFRLRAPSPALIISIIALVAATVGTAYGFGLGVLSNGAKNKTVGVGKLTYVSTSTSVPSNPAIDTLVTASCPGNLRPIGGGVDLTPQGTTVYLTDGYLTTNGYAASVHNQFGASITAKTAVACATSRTVTGSP